MWHPKKMLYLGYGYGWMVISWRKIMTKLNFWSYLGVTFDSTCCLDACIAKLGRDMGRNINFYLYSARTIRKYLRTAEKMINVTVASRLDYCNSLLYGAKQYQIDRLQCCQNNAARSIYKIHKFDNINPMLKELQWLPVDHRISYQIPHLQGTE